MENEKKKGTAKARQIKVFGTNMRLRTFDYYRHVRKNGGQGRNKSVYKEPAHGA